MKKKICVFLFNGFSDWEIAYLAPEINKSEEFELIYFSKDGSVVFSMGGLSILPNTSLSQIDTNDVHMLILPGGRAWDKGENNEIESLIKSLIVEKKPIAAICGATIFLAEQRILDNLQHTSNALFYLQNFAKTYSGENLYVNTPAITGGNIITASGIYPIEFAREIFEYLKLYSQKDIEKWFQLFKNSVWSE